MKFTCTGTVQGFGMNDDGQSGFIKVQPEILNGQGVNPADPRAERTCPLTVRYSPNVLKDQNLLTGGARLVIEGIFGVFHKDKQQDNNQQGGGYGRGNSNGYKARPYTNYYFEVTKISKAA